MESAKEEQVKKGQKSYCDVRNANEMRMREKLKNTNIKIVVPDTDEGCSLWGQKRNKLSPKRNKSNLKKKTRWYKIDKQIYTSLVQRHKLSPKRNRLSEKD